MSTRQNLLKILLLSSLLLLGKEVASVEEKGATRLKDVLIATSGGLEGLARACYAMALKHGFYQKEGIRVDFLTMKQNLIIPALVHRDISYAASGGAVIQAAALGIPVKFIMATNTTRPTYIYSKAEIKTVKDLKGKRVGVGGIGSREDYTTRDLLSRYGLNPDKDVIILSVFPTMKLPSLFAGSIDAAFGTPEEAMFAKIKGYNVLVRVSDIIPTTGDALGVHEDKIKNDRDEVKKIITGTLKGIIWASTHKDEVVEDVVKKVGYAKETTSKAYDEYVLYYNRDGIFNEKLVQEDLEKLKDSGFKIKKEIIASQIIDHTLLLEVKRQLGLGL